MDEKSIVQIDGKSYLRSEYTVDFGEKNGAARVTVAHLPSRSALAAVTPPRADRAFSTWATQWAHIMPSIFRVLVIVFSSLCSSGSSVVMSTGQLPWQGDCSGGATDLNLLLKKRRRKALDTTHTELRLMAAAANMGLSCQPSRG